MIDLHCHILPGLDDGASDEGAALEMGRIAQRHGTTGLVATPHLIEGDFMPAWNEIISRCETLQVAFRSEGLPLTVFPGAEVALHMDLLDRFTGPGPYCINGGNYMLVELPALEIPAYAEEFFFRLQSRGIRPVLAHPERNRKVTESPQILAEWLRRGVLVQLNAPSLLGRMGERVAATAELLLRNGMVHLIGSDAHGVEHRRPKLDEAAAKIGDILGREEAAGILERNPQLILDGKNIEPSPVGDLEKDRTLAVRGLKSWLAGMFNR